MPNYIELLERWPHCSLEASEEFVGLPEGQMGNSEVGHLNLGTGPAGPPGPAADRQVDLDRRLLRAAGSARPVRGPRKPTTPST
jgi:hypothetical protein